MGRKYSPSSTEAINSVHIITQGMDALRKAYNKSGAENEDIKDYLGDILTASSFTRQDAISGDDTHYKRASRHDKLSPYVTMMNNIHILMRFGLEKRAGIQLDEKRLKPETQSLLNDIRTNINDYQQAIRHLRKESGKDFVNGDMRGKDTDVQQCLEKARLLVEKLKVSELVTARTTPLIVKDVSMDARNKDKLGCAMFLFKTATLHITDSNKMPGPLKDYLLEEIGFTTEIAQAMRRKFLTHSTLAKTFDGAYASLLNRMVEAIHIGKHQLQMLNLLQERGYMKISLDRASELKTDMSASIPFMLHAAGINELYPDNLQNSEECALVLSTILKKAGHKGFSREAGILMKTSLRRGGNNAEALQSLQTLGDADPDKESLYRRQISLVSEFIKAPQRFTDTVKTQTWQ